MKRIFMLTGLFLLLIGGANAQIISTKKVKVETRPVTAVNIDKKVSSTDSQSNGEIKKFNRKKLTPVKAIGVRCSKEK